LGYLPGDIGEKLAPYLRPLNDALNERLGGRRVKQLMTEGAIEIAPIAFMRGRTLNNAFIVIDEAQNCTYGQIKMMLTRLGWHSTMVVTGDPDQSDLLDGLSGLAEIAGRLDPIADRRGAVGRRRHRPPSPSRRHADRVMSPERPVLHFFPP
jgi:phosphate starvation-inducible PhoH-like protein